MNVFSGFTILLGEYGDRGGAVIAVSAVGLGGARWRIVVLAGGILRKRVGDDYGGGE